MRAFFVVLVLGGCAIDGPAPSADAGLPPCSDLCPREVLCPHHNFGRCWCPDTTGQPAIACSIPIPNPD